MSRDPHERCAICRSLGVAETTLHLATNWRLRAHPNPCPVAGWLILDLVRHAEGWDELTDEETAEFGALVRAASSAIRAGTQCSRVYLLSFCESVPHVHMHLAPRHADDPRTSAWALADLYRAVQSGNAPPADPARCEAVAESIRRSLRPREAARSE